MDSAVSCWHCRSRRWKCDSGKPACQKCIRSGVHCPGYGATKPIRFRNPSAPANFQAAKSARVSSHKSFRCGTREATHDESTSAWVVPHRRAPLARICTQLGLSLSISGEKSMVEGLQFMCLTLRPCYEGSYLECSVQPASPSSIMRAAFHPDPRPVEIMASIRVCSLLAFLECNQKHLTHASNVQLRTRLLEYTGVAYSMINATVNDDHTYSVATMAEGIHYLMFLEIMNMRKESVWQIHAKAAARLYLQAAISSTPTYAGFQFAMLIIVNNTTSPCDQQVYAEMLPQHVTWIESYHNQIKFGAFASPWPLIAQMIQINGLRTKHGSHPVKKHELHKLIEDIENFCHEEWAATNMPGNQSKIWSYLGRVTKIAMAAFALASLSQCALPRRQAADYRRELFVMLNDPIVNEYLVRFGLQWHVIVAGFLAKTGTIAQRNFVRQYLEWSGQISGFRGSALDVLEHFWATESLTTWDECFDKPYFFVRF